MDMDCVESLFSKVQWTPSQRAGKILYVLRQVPYDPIRLIDMLLSHNKLVQMNFGNSIFLFAEKTELLLLIACLGLKLCFGSLCLDTLFHACLMLGGTAENFSDMRD